MILCISDLHLGSPVCKTDKLLSILQQQPWKQIIINGDLLDSKHFKRYSKDHWEVLKQLRKSSKWSDVILVKGNHDESAEILCDILGLTFVEEYALHLGKKTIWFEHGHRFDGFIKKHPLITEIASAFYYLVQRLDPSSRMAKRIKTQSKHWLNASEIIAKKAIAFAQTHQITDIVCGHVHQASIVEEDGVRYWNTGTFCDNPSHYLLISEEGDIELKEL